MNCGWESESAWTGGSRYPPRDAAMATPLSSTSGNEGVETRGRKWLQVSSGPAHALLSSRHRRDGEFHRVGGVAVGVPGPAEVRFRALTLPSCPHRSRSCCRAMSDPLRRLSITARETSSSPWPRTL